MIQVISWKVQYTDKKILQGGSPRLTESINTKNGTIDQIEEVRILSLQLITNSFRDMYWDPKDQWYHDTTPIDVVYPLEYRFEDNTLMRIEEAVDGNLIITDITNETII